MTLKRLGAWLPAGLITIGRWALVSARQRSTVVPNDRLGCPHLGGVIDERRIAGKFCKAAAPRSLAFPLREGRSSREDRQKGHTWSPGTRPSAWFYPHRGPHGFMRPAGIVTSTACAVHCHDADQTHCYKSSASLSSCCNGCGPDHPRVQQAPSQPDPLLHHRPLDLQEGTTKWRLQLAGGECPPETTPLLTSRGCKWGLNP